MITLNMIVKNEQDNLPNCLRSVKDFVDEIVIVDTGSTDNTVSIAKEHGATVGYFTWVNHFSAARNHALSLVKTPWTLFLDADDIVSNPEILSDITEQAHKNRFSGIWSIYRQDKVCYQRRLQLFKTKDYFWEGAVHESPQIKPGKNQDTILSDLVVIHRKPPDRCPEAARKYLDILLEQDAENWLGLAESYKYLALHDSENATDHLLNAEANYNSAYSWDKSNPDTKYICLVNQAQINIQLIQRDARHFTLAKRYAQAGIGFMPHRAECWVFLGFCYQHEQDWYKAKQCYEKALSLQPPTDGVGLVYFQYYDVIPRQMLTFINQKIEDERIQKAIDDSLMKPSVILRPGQV